VPAEIRRMPVKWRAVNESFKNINEKKLKEVKENMGI
jgi:hypothetical protein